MPKEAVREMRTTSDSHLQEVAIVVIGRNEGERLRKSLGEALRQTVQVIYVDSASDDGSADLARELGVFTIELDRSRFLSAAVARNVGFGEVRRLFPHCRYVQFVDGDCILAPGWIEQAIQFFGDHERTAIVCGRRFEAHPESSIYNRLIDEEWNTPVGRADSSGGDALVRADAFEEAGGFRSDLKAGEEPELGARLRAAGWEIWRLDAPMTEHDAKLSRLRQWWQRCARGGYGYAEVWSKTASLPVRVFEPQLRSCIFWALLAPIGAMLLAFLFQDARVLLLLVFAYAFQTVRIALRRDQLSARGLQTAGLLMLAKIPEVMGALSYFTGRPPDRVPDYKTA